mgnify:CR=1 FL=1
MSRAVQRRAPRVPTSAIPYAVLAGSLLLTLVTAFSVATTADATEQLRFEHEVQQTQSTIEARIETYISMLRGLAGLFAADDAISRAQFRAYVEPGRWVKPHPMITKFTPGHDEPLNSTGSTMRCSSTSSHSSRRAARGTSASSTGTG